MTEQQELWNGEKAEKHARWAASASWLIYRPFAKKIVRTLSLLNQEITIIDLGTGAGSLSFELARLLPDARIIGDFQDS